ncbi:hypothetical protein [Risungbinella massiliensis]|nr:hypothetical protein [Risungbinella massiliensis]
MTDARKIYTIFPQPKKAKMLGYIQRGVTLIHWLVFLLTIQIVYIF